MSRGLAPDEWFSLVSKIRKGEPLPESAREFVSDVLELVMLGEDPRKFAGTKRTRGRRGKAHGLIALYLRALDIKDGSGKSESNVGKVSQMTGLSTRQVERIKSKLPPQGFRRDADLDSVIDSLERELLRIYSPNK